MERRFGNLLKAALAGIESAVSPADAAALASTKAGSAREGCLPVVMKTATLSPEKDEDWAHYRKRSGEALASLRGFLKDVLGVEERPLYLANAIAAELDRDQVARIAELDVVEKVELDPRLQVVVMDDAIDDVGAPFYRGSHGGVDGSGVAVAVLDSGIDKQHPYLDIADSVTTADESDDIPGDHGTHCAGSIASQDATFPGVATGVQLINVKVLRADGTGKHTDLAAGVDEAVDRGADILSMSLGFNHLPRWSSGGHGWMCTDGHCPLCVAVDNASQLDGRLVVVAAGNEHSRAEALRRYGLDNTFDTELGCPGQARHAFTVGAITKRTLPSASFMSHGATSYGDAKPDVSAPGVNITSTVPVPRGPNGRPRAKYSRADLFARKSGTSMATPIVAGCAALITQALRDQGRTFGAGRREVYDHSPWGCRTRPRSLGGRRRPG